MKWTVTTPLIAGADLARFASRVRCESTGCHTYAGSLSTQGYGRFVLGGRVFFAHRISYRLHVGELVDGMDLDHLCRNRACVNPTHLDQVVPTVNILRGEGAAAINARKTHCKHGHEFTADNIYTFRGFRHCRTCRRIDSHKRFLATKGV